MRRHLVNNMRKHLVIIMRRHLVNNMRKHLVIIMRRHLVNNMRRHLVNSMRRHLVNNMRKHLVIIMRRHLVNNMRRHLVIIMRRHLVNNMRKHLVIIMRRHLVKRISFTRRPDITLASTATHLLMLSFWRVHATLLPVFGLPVCLSESLSTILDGSIGYSPFRLYHSLWIRAQTWRAEPLPRSQ